LQPQRSLTHPPLFQVMFALQDELSESLRLPGLTVSPFQVDTGTSKFDLTFTIVQSASNTILNCCAEYNTDLFERSTIRRVLRHFELLLEAILLNPDKNVSELPVPGEEIAPISALNMIAGLAAIPRPLTPKPNTTRG